MGWFNRKSEELFSCCGQTFKSKADFEAHIRKVHGGARPEGSGPIRSSSK
jgi:uncharacterized C2H2 Zn-finger protein